MEAGLFICLKDKVRLYAWNWIALGKENSPSISSPQLLCQAEEPCEISPFQDIVSIDVVA